MREVVVVVVVRVWVELFSRPIGSWERGGSGHRVFLVWTLPSEVHWLWLNRNGILACHSDDFVRLRRRVAQPLADSDRSLWKPGCVRTID